ncbi:hypothetical protein BKA56DRAFT_69428 [Ilyonectria sp. MPI-CAGE-AT-0026]|nr:hypothetical protein BKA56DRAFT_69428 [Ilyonectria sp. MPI-CAGE-AT-0026]
MSLVSAWSAACISATPRVRMLRDGHLRHSIQSAGASMRRLDGGGVLWEARTRVEGFHYD